MAAKANPESGLLPQHELFAEQYLVDFNAAAAYQRAGYKASGDAAYAAASRLLAKPEVQAHLARRKAELMQQVGVTQEAVLQRLAFIAFGDKRTLFDDRGNLKALSDMTPEEAAMISGVEVFEEFEGRGKDRTYIGKTKKVKFINQLDGLKTIGTHFGMFKQQHEHKHDHRVQGMADVLEEIDGADTGPGPASSRRD